MDWDAPYSQMPPSVLHLITRVKQKVKDSYLVKQVKKRTDEKK
jgi:hypothetical protein